MRIAITLGDPNGIGPEIAIKAAVRLADSEKVRPGQGVADPTGVIETVTLLASSGNSSAA
jgi:4-hydroxy-L-threonine phosphate dehydrogenase PdxA